MQAPNDSVWCGISDVLSHQDQLLESVQQVNALVSYDLMIPCDVLLCFLQDEEEGEEAPDREGLMTPSEGLVTPSGVTSIPAGVETPDMIELRKKTIEEAMEQG